MQTYLRPALTMTVAFTVLTGLAYPLAMTGIAQALFPAATTGSLIAQGDRVVGSSLIGQGFVTPGYLHPRPSASGWNAAGTGASNLGPTSAALVAGVEERKVAFAAENGGVVAPVDAVTTSGSGLDPDISPDNALAQVERIATARGADPASVRAVIDGSVQGRWLGIYGNPRVNVLETNIALDEALGAVPPVPAN